MALSTVAQERVNEERDRRLRQIGLRVSERRQDLGLTQQALGDRLGMSQGNITRIENGKQNITIDTLCKLAEGLDMSLDELFVGTDPEPPPSR